MSTELTDQEKEALAIGERLEQQEQERDQKIYENAREGEQEALQFAGKFRSAEDLEKAYLELEKKLGKPKEESTDEETSDDTEDEQQPDAPEGEVQGDEEGNQQGDEQEAVPQLSQEDANSILESLGGQEQFDAMISWGSENLPEADQQAFNEVLASGNPAAIRLAAEGLMARFKANADFQGTPVRGRPGSSEPGAKPYRSRAEVNAAMSDYRYDADPAYRNDVMARLAASPDELP
jgi:hypothetical protein